MKRESSKRPMEAPDSGTAPLAMLIALALMAIGLGALAAPRRSSRAYGLPADDDTSLAYVRALGARDLALGLMFLSAPRERRHLARSAGACALVAATDLTIVGRGRGRRASKSLLIHALGAAGLIWSIALI
jgi:hypothetical protein